MVQKTKWSVVANRWKTFYKSFNSLIIFLAAFISVVIYCSSQLTSCQKGNGGDSIIVEPIPKPAPAIVEPIPPKSSPEEQAVVQILDCVECKAILKGTAKGEAIVSDDALHYRIMAQNNAEKKIKNKVLRLLTGSSFRINRVYAKKIIAQGKMIDAEFEIKGNKAITKITYRFEVPY